MNPIPNIFKGPVPKSMKFQLPQLASKFKKRNWNGSLEHVKYEISSYDLINEVMS